MDKEDNDWGSTKAPWGSCKLRPTGHLIDRMKDTERGWSKEEVINAAKLGSKETKSKTKYIGEYGRCKVVVIKKKCNTIVTVLP